LVHHVWHHQGAKVDFTCHSRTNGWIPPVIGGSPTWFRDNEAPFGWVLNNEATQNEHSNRAVLIWPDALLRRGLIRPADRIWMSSIPHYRLTAGHDLGPPGTAFSLTREPKQSPSTRDISHFSRAKGSIYFIRERSCALAFRPYLSPKPTSASSFHASTATNSTHPAYTSSLT
jgi:hypothetical protein